MSLFDRAAQAIETLLGYAGQLEDRGPQGSGWKSPELVAAIADAGDVLATLKGVRVAGLPFAVFDEFAEGCEDRVADHYRAAIAAHQARQAVPQGYRADRVSDDSVRLYGPDGETWLIEAGDGFTGFVHRLGLALAADQARQAVPLRQYQRNVLASLADWIDSRSRSTWAEDCGHSGLMRSYAADLQAMLAAAAPAPEFLHESRTAPPTLAEAPSEPEDTPEHQAYRRGFQHGTDMANRRAVLSAHDLYTDADKDRPDAICDRDGRVTLDLCKRCGKGEAEIDGPCQPTQADAPLSFNCTAGCGACGVELTDFVTHATQAQDGAPWVTVASEPQIVSTCCGSPVEVWDERKGEATASVIAQPEPEATPPTQAEAPSYAELVRHNKALVERRQYDVADIQRQTAMLVDLEKRLAAALATHPAPEQVEREGYRLVGYAAHDRNRDTSMPEAFAGLSIISASEAIVYAPACITAVYAIDAAREAKKGGAQ